MKAIYLTSASLKIPSESDNSTFEVLRVLSKANV